jgi:2-polyprenyl-6-methoxyphenol hydroxylase-like FAD-dependent oxidoreductase
VRVQPGLVLALWLTKLRAEIRIIDKTAEPGTASRALMVQARTLELYRQVGLADNVVRAVIRFQPFGSGSRASLRRAFRSKKSAWS